jgi:hypothetical protein
MPIKEISTGGVATGPRETRDQAKLDWIYGRAKDYRDCRRSRLRCKSSFGAAGTGNDGDLTADKIRGHGGNAIVPPLHPVVLERDIPVFNEACFAQAFAECGQITRCGIGRSAVDESDHRHRRLLRPRRQRPRRRTAEQGDELALIHSITSSARASSAGGTSKADDLRDDRQVGSLARVEDAA